MSARLATLLAAAAGLACGPRAPDRPDVVLVLCDTLRPDHLEHEGYGRATSPFLAELASSSAVFDHAFSTSSWTPPATASVFTGLFPTRHGVTSGFEPEPGEWRRAEAGETVDLDVVPLPASRATLPELLAREGYATFGVATNVHVGGPLGFDRGFDRFAFERDADAARVGEILDGWADELARARPSFLYLHLNDAHTPWHARAPWYEEGHADLDEKVARYDSEIRFLDEHLRAWHERFGWAEGTVLCVVSDHGEAFGEHGVVGHGPSLIGVLNRVLFLVRAPGVEPRRVDANVSLADVLPTLLDLAGVARAPAVDGRSLRPLLEDGRDARAAFEERPLFAHRRGRRGVAEDRFLWSVIRGRWKLVVDGVEGGLALYDVEADPGETRDLATERPEVVAELRREQEAFLERHPPPARAAVRVELDAELARHLKALGYAGDG